MVYICIWKKKKLNKFTQMQASVGAHPDLCLQLE